MVWKLDKVLCCMFLFAILVVDPAQNLTKYKRWLCVIIELTKRNIATCNSCIHVIDEPKTPPKMCRVKAFQHTCKSQPVCLLF